MDKYLDIVGFPSKNFGKESLIKICFQHCPSSEQKLLNREGYLWLSLAKYKLKLNKIMHCIHFSSEYILRSTKTKSHLNLGII